MTEVDIEDEDLGLATDIVGEAAATAGVVVVVVVLVEVSPPAAALLLSSINFRCSSLSSKLRWREAASTGVVGDGSPMIGESWEAGDEVVAVFVAAGLRMLLILLLVVVLVLSLCLVIADFVVDDDDEDDANGPTERDTRL